MRSKDISDSFYLQLHQQNNPTKLSKPSSKEKSSGKESDSDCKNNKKSKHLVITYQIYLTTGVYKII
jgi:hypothetical protein